MSNEELVISNLYCLGMVDILLNIVNRKVVT